MANGRLSQSGQALLALLRYDRAATRGLLAHEWEAVLDLALRHDVAPLLHAALPAGDGDVPQVVRKRLEEARRAAGLDNLGNLREFRRVAAALHAQGIAVIALKGLHLAELVYADVSLRPMSDLDILVPRSELERAIEVLTSLGYGYGRGIPAAAAATLDLKCEVGLARRGTNIWLEVHWSLAEPPDRYAAVLEEIWRGAASAPIGGADTLVMSPEFLLLHVCAHLACAHVFAFSLRGLCDIAEILSANPAIDWRCVADHGQRHGWTRGVAAALRLARDHLGAAVPDSALAALGGDTLDPDMLSEALLQLVDCVDMPAALRSAPNLLTAAGSAPSRRFAVLLKRIFVPRAELALSYGLPLDSVRLPLYYAIRLTDLVRQYAAWVCAGRRSDPRSGDAAARHARLAAWLSAV